MYEITIDYSELEKFQEALEKFPEKVDAILAEAMVEAEEYLYYQIADYPEPPGSPVQWDTPNQQLWFFRTNGFNGGIPHERQGAFPNAFEQSPVTVELGLIHGAVFSVEDWVKHVVGDNEGQGQSKIHAYGERWPTLPKTAEDARAGIVEIFNNAIQKACSEGISP